MFAMGRKAKYTREEKVAAVKLATESGRNVTSVANEYGVHPNTIWKWKEQYTTNPVRAFTSQPDSSEAAELKRMKRRIEELEAENDFLKKAAAYFAKGSQEDTP
jgi:transposase